MTDTRRSMPHDLRQRISDQLEEFWEKIGMHHTGVSGPAYHGVPAETDVSAGAEGLNIEMELPGMKEADIEVSVHDRLLTISGEKHAEREVKERTYYLSERAYGRFERQFTLPDSVDADKITARYHNGVLSITAPRKAGAQASQRRIEIKSR